MEYLDAPMKQVEGTQAKARVLTLLGYSQRTRGNFHQAEVFHEEALKLSRQEGDQP